MGKRSPRYVPITRREHAEVYGDGNAGDPWTQNGNKPDAVDVFDRTWRATTEAAEETIGWVFAFGDRAMQLVAQAGRSVIGAQNSRTGVVMWVPERHGRFGRDQLQKHHLGIYRDGLQTADTPVAKMLGHTNARQIRFDMDAEYRKRHGNPAHRSQFKYPNIGYRRKK